MPQGQQRRNNARGRIQAPSFPRLDTEWSASNDIPTEIRVQCLNGLLPILGPGVLQLRIVETGELPSAQTIVGPEVWLTYTAAPTGSFTLELEGNDPAIRNSAGGFLTQGTFVIRPEVYIAPYESITVDSPTAATVTENATGSFLISTMPFIPPSGATYFALQTGVGGSLLVKDFAGANVASALPGELWKISFSPMTSWTAVKLLP